MYTKHSYKSRWVYLVVLSMIIQLVSGASLRAEDIVPTCRVGDMEVAFKNVCLMETGEDNQQQETTVIRENEQKEARFDLELVNCAGVNLDKELKVTLPKELTLIRDETIALKIKEDNNIVQVGSCEFTTNEEGIGVGTIKFLEALKNSQVVNFGFGVGVKSNIEIEDGETKKLPLKFAVDDMTRSLEVEFKGKDAEIIVDSTPPKIEKTHEQFNPATEQIVWIVTVTAGGRELRNDIVKEMFDSSQLELVRIEQNGGEFHDYTMTQEDGQTVVKIKLPSLLPKKKCVFRVVTHIKEGIYSKSNNTVIIKNTASLQDKNGVKLTEQQDPTDQQTINVNWIAKRATPHISSNNGVVSKYIIWTIDVNAHQANLAGKTFKDFLPSGLKLVPETLKINNQPMKNLSALGTYQYTQETGSIVYEAGEKPFVYSSTIEFKMNKNLTPAQAHGKYQITYRTDVIDEEIGEMGLCNLAGIEGFDNNWFYIYRPLPMDHIKKEFVRYNADRHTISWCISANMSSQKVKNIVITDELPKGLNLAPNTIKIGNTFIQSEPTPLQGLDMVAQAKCEKNKNGNYVLTCLIEKENKSTFSSCYIVEFETAIEDKAVYANNVPKEVYTNWASAEYEGLDKQPTRGRAQAVVISNVLSKFAGDFDSETKQMTWYIVVNQNGMAIQDLELIDELDENQKYVPGTFQVLKSESYKDWKDNEATKLNDIKLAIQNGNLINLPDPEVIDGEKGQVLKYELGTIHETYTFVLKTVVDTKEPFQPNGDDPIFSNVANISSPDIYADIQPVKAQKTVTNSFIEKFGEQVGKDNPIDWRILVNPNQLELEDVKVIDALDKELKLELDKLKIYKTSVANDKIKSLTFSDIEKLKKTEVQLAPESVDYNKSENTLSVNLGEIDACYLITFQTSVVNPKITGEYVNEASIQGVKGVPFNVVSKLVKAPTEFSSSWGSGTKNIGTLTVTKTDKDNPDIKLQGAEFKLSDGIYTLTMQTDATGTAKFEDLVIGKTYTLYESKAPEGYILDDTKQEIPLKVKDVAITLTNKKAPTDGKLKIIKVDEEDESKTLEGAEFTLVGNGEIFSQATDENGVALFEGLALNVPYELTETKAPQGYAKVDTSETIQFTKPELIERKIANTKEKGTLKVIKVDAEDTTKTLEGVEFTLVGGEENYTVTTDKEGVALFKDLTLNMPYELKETKTLEGYIANSEIETITLTSAEVVEKVIKNEREKGTLKVIKVDEANHTKVLEGAEFTLVGESENYTATTDDKGIAVFEGLTLDKEYELTETKAPEGYVGSSKAEIITLTSKEVVEKTITNERDKGTLKIIKVDATDKTKVLKGAEFTLVGENENYTATTDDKGIAVFEGLTLDKKYELTETKTPEGYVGSSKAETITLKSKEVVEKTVENEKVLKPEIEKGTLKILKVDAADKTTPLKGAEFTLVGESENYTATTDDKGIAVFGGLTLDKEYELTETKVPEGYVGSSEAETIILTSKAVVEKTVENEKIPEPKPEPEPEPKKGTLKVIKLDSETEGLLEGAEFKLSIDGKELTQITDSNGEAIFEELPIGQEYVLEETKAPQGYILDRTTRGGLIVDSQVVKIKFYNEKEPTPAPEPEPENKKGVIQVIKLDKDTDKPLAGAKFTLYVGDKHFSQRTNGSGLAIFRNLPVGESYTLEESEPPDGYIKEEGTKSGEITTSSALTIYNKKDTSKDPEPEPEPPSPEKPKGTVEVIKLDEDTKQPLAGAEFELRIGERYFREITDSNGKARFEGLPVGEWFTLIESKAPEGYILDRTTKSGLIVNSEVIKLKVYNKQEPQPSPVPQPEQKPTPKPTPIQVIVVKTEPEPNEAIQETPDTLTEETQEEQVKEENNSNIDESASASILDDPIDDNPLQHKGIIIEESNKDALVAEEELPSLGESTRSHKLMILLGWLFIIMGILSRFRKQLLTKGE